MKQARVLGRRMRKIAIPNQLHFFRHADGRESLSIGTIGLDVAGTMSFQSWIIFAKQLVPAPWCL